jgi:pyruvate dehydrogenase E2 component (dihydrolipoamide acetyltransferase)
MRRAIDQWTTTASLALMFGALLACKKKTDAPAPEASAAAATVTAVASAPVLVASAVPTPALDAGVAVATVAVPEIGAVKRFPDKEKVASGAVKVTLDDSKVYDDPDNTTPSVASLSKDLFVVRLATLGTDWILVDFPSGVGKLSPGWIEAKSVGAQVQTITKAAVAAQSATATAAAAKPATTAVASAKPATSAATTAALAPAPPAPAPIAPATVRPKPGAILARPHK